jgi:hypothetical protein
MSNAPQAERTIVSPSRSPRRENERRRSERLLLTVPIHVEGVDATGEKFGEETRTIVINREGARIFLKRPVAAGAVLDVSTKIGHRKAQFRVVGPTQPITGAGGEWGIECLGKNCDLWRIGFPPPQTEPGFGSALIECQKCHTANLTHLSLVELEVLGTSGLLVRECEKCGSSTPWSYSEPPKDISGKGSEMPLPYTQSKETSKSGIQRRVHNRAALQLPIRVRSYYGIEEFIRSENVSRGGLCFITDKIYEVGEVLLITCPYEKVGQNFEVRGQVVRRREMMGTARLIYGVSYER